MTSNINAPASPTLLSELTCPRCGHRQTESMPLNACLYFYDCPACNACLRPKAGDCCVFCSYGSVPCPSQQPGYALDLDERGCCGADAAIPATLKHLNPPHHQAHWENVYRVKSASSVSWYRPHLEVSIELLEAGGFHPGSRVIDVGGGASTLVDDLLDRGAHAITVLDLSAAALQVARDRLKEGAQQVEWLVGDVTQVDLPEAGYDLWHDRAVLHFLTSKEDAVAYATQATRAVRRGGFAVIGGFAPDGPERCSGLEVARRSPADVAGILGAGFELVGERYEHHQTPDGSDQAFAYALLRRI